MLEKYEKNFDEKRFVDGYMAKKGIKTRKQAIAMLRKVRSEVNRPMVRPIEEPKPAVDTAQLQTNAAESTAAPHTAPKAAKTPGRNDPCPSGSGKKYKNCSGKNA